MKKILVICFCLLLMGGLIMPAQAHNFTIYLDSDSGDGANASFYLKGKFVGKTDENEKVVFNIDDLEPGKKYNVTIKKEGFRDKILENQVYKGGDNAIRCSYSDYRIIPLSEMSPFTHEMPHESTPEPTHGPVTPVPAPTVTPLPEGYKSPEQRISELENATAEHETKISWLEGKVKGILSWIRIKFGDLI